MAELLRVLAFWPFYRLQATRARQRFERLARAATHHSLRVGDRGVELLPGGLEVPWTAIEGATWTSQFVARLTANDGADAIVTLRTGDGRRWVVGPFDVEVSDVAAIRCLKERGLLSETPEDGGRTQGMTSQLFDALWLVGLLLLVLALAGRRA